MANARIDDLRKRLEKEPQSRLFAQLAEELRKAGEFDEAIGVCRAGLEKHQNYPSARMTLGRALLEKDDVAAARAEFEAVLKGAPDNILASRLLGESLERQAEPAAALDRYRTTLTLAPGDAQLTERIGALERELAAAGGAAEAPERPAAESSEAPAAEESEAEPEPPPLKLVDADEDFEIERPYESQAVVAGIQQAAPAEAFEAPQESPLDAFEPERAEASATLEEPPAEEVTTAVEESPAAEPPVGQAPGPVPEAADELATVTLGELYLRQGHRERALATYRAVVARDPDNQRAQARVAELEGAAAPAAAPSGATDRKAALRRTIRRLEAFLASVKKGA